MGDGGLWHSGLTSGVAGAVYNKQDTVLAVINNGFTSATGQQRISEVLGQLPDPTVEEAHQVVTGMEPVETLVLLHQQAGGSADRK